MYKRQSTTMVYLVTHHFGNDIPTDGHLRGLHCLQAGMSGLILWLSAIAG